MDCEAFLESYSDFFDGHVEEDDLSQFCQHLLDCSACAEYDGVIRRGLRLLREIDPPDTTPDFIPRLQRRFLDPVQRTQGLGEYVRVAGVAVLTVAGLMAIASLPMLRPAGGAVELPPVVVDLPNGTPEVHSLWGPPPTFAPPVSFLKVPDFPDDALLLRQPDRFSLFRKDVGKADASRARTESEVVAGE